MPSPLLGQCRVDRAELQAGPNNTPLSEWQKSIAILLVCGALATLLDPVLQLLSFRASRNGACYLALRRSNDFARHGANSDVQAAIARDDGFIGLRVWIRHYRRYACICSAKRAQE